MLQRIVPAVLRRPARVLWRVRRDGYNAVPADGAAISAEPPQLLRRNRPLRFIGKIEYLDSWKTRYLLPALGMIPIDRERGVQGILGRRATAAPALARAGGASEKYHP